MFKTKSLSGKNAEALSDLNILKCAFKKDESNLYVIVDYQFQELFTFVNLDFSVSMASTITLLKTTFNASKLQCCKRRRRQRSM